MRKTRLLFSRAIFVTLILMLTLMLAAPAQAASEADIEASIVAGLAWLADMQGGAGAGNGDGSWGTSNKVGHTGLAVLKFETRAHELGLDPFETDSNEADYYEYSQNVIDGLNYIFSQLSTIAIDTQHGGADDPDIHPAGGNNMGVHYSGNTYETSIALMAIAASNAPGRVVVGGALNGWTYEAVAGDIVDYLAWGQTDTGNGRGGWYYIHQDDDGPEADNSNAGYAVLGLGYAEADPPYGMNIAIPAFVKSEMNFWIDWIQDDVGGDPADGGSAYATWNTGWENILKTGNLLYQMAFVNDTQATPRVQDAIDYLVRHWEHAPDWDPGWGKHLDPSFYQAMYCAMKGLEALGVANIDGINWYDEFTDNLVTQQEADGSWPDSPAYQWPNGGSVHWAGPTLSTVWSLLTLEKAVPGHLLTLSPALATNPLGMSHTVTAELKDEAGNPIPGVSVTFTVTGVNPTSGSAPTNASGIAEWSYVGNNLGVDTITAEAVVGNITITSNAVGKKWVEGEPPVEVGGEVYPINKLAVLLPWIALAATLIIGTAVVVRHRKVPS